MLTANYGHYIYTYVFMYIHMYYTHIIPAGVCIYISARIVIDQFGNYETTMFDRDQEL